MANTVVRPLGYTGTVESLTWSGLPSSGRAYLWGGGGGGGGKDSAPGGRGSGGGFSLVNFTVSSGDVLTVVVGGPGGVGTSGTTGQGGGFAGASYLSVGTIFNTRTAVASPPTFAQFNPNYCAFLNTYGVWESNTRTENFDRSYTVYFPVTGLYTFTASADNGAVVYLDGTPRFSATSFVNTFEQPVQVTAGNHTVRIQATNTGGPGSVALTISGGENYSGARGGNAGGAGTSGGGGGGGGATVLLRNGVVIGVAGGGGGGGGGGNKGVAQGASAPGIRGQASPGINNGQNGTNKNGDGGGGGGGGGGYGGGNGGQSPGGDIGGEAGAYGLSYSLNDASSQSTSSLPAGATYPYWNRNRGLGGQGGAVAGYPPSSGTSGYAVIEIDTVGAFVKDAGVWKPIEAAYIKVNNTWQRIQGTYRKTTGGFFIPQPIWQPISDSYSPLFSQSPANVGINPREADGDAGQGGGGGGCCVVSTAFADQGIWSNQQKDELIAWCEARLHNHVLGECFRRGYQVVGSKIGLPILKTSWGRNYGKWAFDNGTRMVRGKSFSWWSVPNSLLWISAFMLVGSVVTTRYANRCWKSTGKD